jgi:hypothetical protein
MSRAIVAVAVLVVAAVAPEAVAGQQADAAVAPVQERTAAAEVEGPVVVPEPSEKAMHFYRTGMAWWSVFVLWGILIPALILFTGLSARMRDLAQKIGRTWFLTIGAYAALYFVLRYVVDFPLDYVVRFVRQHARRRWIDPAGPVLLSQEIASPLVVVHDACGCSCWGLLPRGAANLDRAVVR